MFSKLHKGLLTAALAGVTLIAIGTGSADPQTTTRFPFPGPFRSPADLAASVYVLNEQNLSPWTAKGTVKNVGGQDFVGSRLVKLQQVTGTRGHILRTVTLAATLVTNLKAGESLSLQKVFTEQPAAGTWFRLVISAGDGNPDNDQAFIRFHGT